MREEIAKKVKSSRQLRGSSGVSREPSVKTAASRSERTTPAKMRRVRWLEVVEVIKKWRVASDEWRATNDS